MSKPTQETFSPRSDRNADWESVVPVRLEDDALLVSVTIPAPLLDCHTFLHTNTGTERVYWAAPAATGSEVRFAGASIAAQLRVLPDIDGRAAERDPYAAIQEDAAKLLADSREFFAETGDNVPHETSGQPVALRPRLFGGFAFQTEFVPDNTWSVYHPAHFILPHFLLTESAEGTWLTIHATDQSGQPAADVARELLVAVRTRYELMTERGAEKDPPTRAADTNQKSKHAIRYPMSKADWYRMVTSATDQFADGVLQKVVLARVAEIRLDTPIDPLQALAYLHATYPTCYRFMFEPVPGHAFFGASPELLVEKAGRQVSTMALAGSIKRGETAANDEDLANQLLSSEKDGREHALVVDSIRSRLEPLTDRLSPPQEPGLLRFHNIQHLHTPIWATLPDPSPVTVLTLVRELHPTPALGGVPREQALSFLLEAEPVPRGWYAGPVGWFDAALDGAFTVAIRSAVCQHSRAWLYAGAGIVAASDPELEWQETDLKFRPMLEALNVATEVDNA